MLSFFSGLRAHDLLWVGVDQPERSKEPWKRKKSVAIQPSTRQMGVIVGDVFFFCYTRYTTLLRQSEWPLCQLACPSIFSPRRGFLEAVLPERRSMEDSPQKNGSPERCSFHLFGDDHLLSPPSCKKNFLTFSCVRKKIA